MIRKFAFSPMKDIGPILFYEYMIRIVG